MATTTSQVQDAVDAALDIAVAKGERGIQVAAFHRGNLIVNRSFGDKDDSGTPVTDDTLFPIFSVSKAVVATAIHLQADRGLLDYDAPLAAYWPEYGVNGKETITIRDVLSHRAGVPQVPAEATVDTLRDWDSMIAGLAQETPTFPRDTQNTYHSLVFGWLLGEVVRRTDPERRSYRDFVREELFVPLQIPNLYIGLPEELEPRVAPLTFPGEPNPPSSDSLTARATPVELRLRPPLYNESATHSAIIPATGGVADAHSVARFFAMLAGSGTLDGVTILRPSTVRGMLPKRKDFDLPDLTYGRQMPVGQGGMWLTVPEIVPPEAESTGVLAHPGAGGTLAWAELGPELSVAILHNRMHVAPSPFVDLGRAVRALALG